MISLKAGLGGLWAGVRVTYGDERHLLRLELGARRSKEPSLVIDRFHGSPAELFAQEGAVLLEPRTIVVASQERGVALGRLLAELLEHRLRPPDSASAARAPPSWSPRDGREGRAWRLSTTFVMFDRDGPAGAAIGAAEVEAIFARGLSQRLSRCRPQFSPRPHNPEKRSAGDWVTRTPALRIATPHDDGGRLPIQGSCAETRPDLLPS